MLQMPASSLRKQNGVHNGHAEKENVVPESDVASEDEEQHKADHKKKKQGLKKFFSR